MANPFIETSYYETLGVLPDASERDIRRQYRRLALAHHPDKPGGDETVFKRIKHAADCLLDAKLRAEYDMLLRETRADLFTDSLPTDGNETRARHAYDEPDTARPKPTATPRQPDPFASDDWWYTAMYSELEEMYRESVKGIDEWDTTRKAKPRPFSTSGKKALRMYDIGQATTYEGSPSEISSSAPEGILWLRSFWTCLDSLNPAASPPLDTVVTPECQFTINGAPPRSLQDLRDSHAQRAALLSEFSHTKYPVKVIDVDLGSGTRLLSVQSTSVSVIKTDPEQTELKVSESTVIELSTVGEKLLATNVTSYLDPTPVMAKLQEIMSAAEPQPEASS